MEGSNRGSKLTATLHKFYNPSPTGGFFLFFLSYKTIGNLATIYYNLQRPVNTIEIRLAKKEDAQFIALLGRITFTETFGHFFRDQKDLIDYYNLTFSVQKIEDGIKKPNNIFWIALSLIHISEPTRPY